MKKTLVLAPLSTIAVAALLAGCASAPPAPPTAPVVRYEQKLGWILHLEDQRLLRLEPPAAVTPVVARKGTAVPPPAPVVAPSLLDLVGDADARVRRRAALAIGRVGLKEGVPPLVTALADGEPDVRAMAAFALGLIGDGSAAQPLTALLSDAAPAVRGRAAEALGLIDARPAAQAVGRVAAEYAQSPGVSGMQPDQEAGSAEAETFRLAMAALVRLRAYDALASAALDPSGRPVSTWWPVAYALQRINDPRAAPALRQLLRAPGKYSAAFAARGLGVLKDQAAVDPLLALVNMPATPLEVRVSAIRALAQIGDPRAAPSILRAASSDQSDRNLVLESVSALGALHARPALDLVQDLLTDPWPQLRIAALRAAAGIDRDQFLLVLSGLDPDRQWIVRAALADLLATLPPELALPRLQSMLDDEDTRVVASVLSALVKLRAPEGGALLLARVKEPDYMLRATVSSLIGELKPAGGAEALRQAYDIAKPDAAYDARVAAIDALAGYGAGDALDTIKTALQDKDWAVRLRAAQAMATLEPSSDYRMAIRPVPAPAGAYDDPQLISPQYSPHVFIETAKGTIEFELSVLDAPQTARNFMTLVRRGFFNGLQIHRVVPNFVVQGGDPRGDGSGGPGYTIRDELNDRPFFRGAVGMALAGPDTGGSQFFITHSPQPHLDAKYTVFGHVVNGMDVVDRIQQGDVIQRVRVWDGKSMQ